MVLVCALLLAATLGLAWWQVEQARALGPEQRVASTPLIVRLPRDWQPDPSDPRRFLLPVADRGRRALFEFERRISFDFERRPTFESLEEWLARGELRALGRVVHVSPAKLGRYDALQIHQATPWRIGRLRLERHVITRVTCLPRGHLVQVTYEPLIDLRPADLQILEQVCRTLRVDDPTLNGRAADYLERAGLRLALDPGWLVVGSDMAVVPGVYIGGNENGSPAWAVSVFRTWLAGGRTPTDLLVDLAADKWLLWDVDELINQGRRGDGAIVTSIRHPGVGQGSMAIVSAWVIVQDPSRVAILGVYAGSQRTQVAEQAARRIAESLEILPLADFPPIGEAEEAGRRLVADLRKAGPAPRWGREALESTYRRVAYDEIVLTRREAVRRDPRQGYTGTLWRRSGQARDVRINWTLDGRAATYRWQADLLYGHTEVAIDEQRPEPEGHVVRAVRLAPRGPRTWRFTPGPAFVPPPAESIVEGWVARRQGGLSAIVEVSSTFGPATHTVLLRSVDKGAGGASDATIQATLAELDERYPRVVVQRDYWPVGVIEAFDEDDAELQAEISPTAIYLRVR